MKRLRPLACSAALPLLFGALACSGASKDVSSPAEQRASWGLDTPGAPQPAAAEEATPSAARGLDDGASRERFDDRPAPQPQARPGLGTEFGETRTSHISSSPFARADEKSPLATGALFYNDEEGARAMASASGFRRTSQGGIEIGGGVLSARLKGEDGRFLSGFEAGGKDFVRGTAGERYSIVVESHVPARLEIVVSVDGLDVIDGRPASFSKRGYLLDPHGSIEIDGFRQSMETVAAFRFGAVRDSYAERKHGDSRNVGVIGLAVFHERGDRPGLWGRGEVRRRLDANPFPGQFATPPGQ